MPFRRLTRFVTAPDGTRVAYHTHVGNAPEGEAEPTLASRPAVLLTNGIGTSENFWRYIVADLEQDHRVVHWDYRGHGRSELSASGNYSLRTHVDDLERVTELMMARGNGRPPHQVGFSMGVRVVLELYRRRPELVPAMTLIAGSPSSPDPSAWLIPLPGGHDTLARSFQALTPLVPRVAPFVHELLASRLAYPLGRATGLLRARAPRADIVEFLLALRRMDPQAFWMMMRGLVEAPPSWDVLPGVRVPTQIIAAKNDLLVPLREMTRMRERLPSAEWVLVEDAGHAGMVEAGTEIAEAVRLFRRSCGLAEQEGSPRAHST
ncbi:alpha/beta fold hydrolase [Vitiosangium sp. GDMCC 1.1324]|uniref:alpha/beta fold hydrolase n=1 Tax=Vitiosangium sp. (strain GDMCC 1.1324) TaxID=2138576 RepID=UPI000D3734AD|nr:alpha/beta hydrolase [Vitiosangium sp. GDMCC 1.1324]PTL85655.1 alpha/beta hydrolase [Vitiosangium sp. GDMCC 1.1324]